MQYSSQERLPKISDALSESEYGTVFKVSGPVVTAKKMFGASMFEMVRVGHNELVGEIIKLEQDIASIQVYEDTTGLTVGDPVLRTGSALSVELGPGIMDNIFDGIQRPLRVIRDLSNSIYVPKGIKTAGLDKEKIWIFQPAIKVGDQVTGGDIIATVCENDLIRQHRIMVPPKAMGEIKYIAPAGEYNLTEIILELEFCGLVTKFNMCQVWPIRQSRPVAEKLRGDHPLLIGKRVLDALFPIVKGGTCVLPARMHHTLCQEIAKYSNCDSIMFVVNERGASEIVTELPELTFKIGNQEYNVMQRTTLVANTSNMLVTAQEASIYTGITIAEYYRDQGMNVIMMADSITCWGEALREISGCLGEMPGEGGYPAYLGSRLSSFYERAGKVICLGNTNREGSVSIIGTISPPSSDYSDPLTSTTLSLAQVFWYLDKKLAQRKHFPSVNWLSSFSKYMGALEPYYESIEPDFSQLRQKIKLILQAEEDLIEIVQLVGKDSLNESDKITFEVARLLREDFLQQNGFTMYDKYCPFYKTTWMMRNFVTYYDLANLFGQKLTWAQIKNNTQNVLYKLSSMKFQDPNYGEDNVSANMKALYEEIQQEFRTLNVTLCN